MVKRIDIIRSTSGMQKWASRYRLQFVGNEGDAKAQFIDEAGGHFTALQISFL